MGELGAMTSDEGEKPAEPKSGVDEISGAPGREQQDTPPPAGLEIASRDDPHPHGTRLLDERARLISPDKDQIDTVAIHEERRQRDLAEPAPGTRHLTSPEPEMSRRLAHRVRRYGGGARAPVSPAKIGGIGRQPVVPRDDAQREQPRAQVRSMALARRYPH